MNVNEETNEMLKELGKGESCMLSPHFSRTLKQGFGSLISVVLPGSKEKNLAKSNFSVSFVLQVPVAVVIKY